MTMRLAPFAGALIFAAFLSACGESEEEIQLRELNQEMLSANATIDSLNYTVESSNLLIDELRARADSLQQVDDKLLASVQRLNREVGKWKSLAAERKRKSDQLATEIERFKRDKVVDQQAIASLRTQSDSLNNELLEAATSIRRQSDKIQRLEVSLAQAQDEVEQLRQAQSGVMVLVAAEDFLEDNGYLKCGRPFGRGFRKNCKLVKKLDANNPLVRKVPIGETTLIEKQLKHLVDRYGKLKKGDDFDQNKENGLTRITFFNALLAGDDVLAVVEN